jgi:hypothetical protein
MSIAKMIRVLIALQAFWLISSASAAEFAQTERDVSFSRDCRRQDAKLSSFFGDIINPGASFFHLGSFKALIHRDGLDRALWLIPVKCLPYEDIEGVRQAARGNPLAVGALTIAYGHADADILPGSYVLLYDGLRVRFVDAHDYIHNKFEVTFEQAPPDGDLDPSLGTVTGTAFSQANITPEGELELYLQLSSDNGDPLMDESGFVKLLMTISIPGIASDDDSPYRELAVPPEEE